MQIALEFFATSEFNCALADAGCPDDTKSVLDDFSVRIKPQGCSDASCRHDRCSKPELRVYKRSFPFHRLQAPEDSIRLTWRKLSPRDNGQRRTFRRTRARYSPIRTQRCRDLVRRDH